MRLSGRLRRMETTAGLTPGHGLVRRISPQEAELAFDRLRDALRADFCAPDNSPCEADFTQVEQDIETLMTWSRQRGLPADADFSRAQDAALESMTDDQLRALIARMDDSEPPAQRKAEGAIS